MSSLTCYDLERDDRSEAKGEKVSILSKYCFTIYI